MGVPVAKNGPRDTEAVLGARYWLTEKGWAATEPVDEAGDDDA